MRPVFPAHATVVDLTAHSVVFSGQGVQRFQISVLEHDLIRVRCYPHGEPRLDRTWMVVGADGDVPREGRRRDDLTPFSLPEFVLQQDDVGVSLRTEKLVLRLDRADFALHWSDADGRAFADDSERRAYAYDAVSHTIWHYLRRRDGEHYYGFGERSGPLDKAGMRLRMLNLDALGYNAETSDPLYKHFPFYITFVPELDIAYGLFYDNLSTTIFDLGREHSNYYEPYRYYQADDGDLDYYLIYGPDIPSVVQKFTALTGRMILPPRWSLGYLGSTMSYTDAPDAQQQLKQFVDLCDKHDIPCDLFQLSSGYTSKPDGKRYVFTWNPGKIPDPAAMVAHFHQAGIRVAANIKPALLSTHPRYDEVVALGGFIQASDGTGPRIDPFWGGEAAHLDFTRPATCDWWQAQVQQALLDYGIDATWNDNNEFEVTDDAQCAGFGEPLPVSMLRPVQTLLMNHASYAAQRAARPDERPYLLSRSGCPGIQRYAATWSGDNFTSWNTLRYNVPMGLGLSLSGAPNTGHDVGGFAGPRPDPELFLRWVQCNIFHPRFCIHSWNRDATANEPWMYPEVLPLVRAAIQFRYRLLPYLYTLFFEAAHSGHPIIRPLVYEFPHDARCHTASFDYLLGPHVLVAPVYEAGARTRDVYLPAGADWCDYHTGTWYTGGQVATLPAPLEHIPLLVRAGGILPLGRLMRHVGALPDDVREVQLFPHPRSGHSTFTLIEDDGISLGYRRGEYARVIIDCTVSEEGISLAVRAEQEQFPLPYGTLEFVLPPGESRPITLVSDGKFAPMSTTDGQQRCTVRLA
ncbi:MAG: glycoside hydrolase family 31 protein [Chloroflexi bacterium]|nr:glycoside hydrolase family 31 protein [Chloroflexota bacterium]